VEVSTLCCARITIITAPSVIPAYSADSASESLFTFSLDSRPAAVVTVIVTELPCESNGTEVTAGVTLPQILPPLFVFLPDSPSLAGQFVVRGSPGCFLLTLSSDGVLEGANSSLTIVALSTPPPPPSLLSATFSSDGLRLVLSFDSDTDQAISILTADLSGTFPCSLVFAFTGADEAYCLWKSFSSLQASLGPNATLGVGDRVGLLPETVRARCANSTLSFDCVSYSFTSGGESVIVAGPVAPLPPSISLSVPLTISPCVDLQLDASQSSGAGGRPWALLQWIVSSPDPDNSSSIAIGNPIDVYPRCTS
jgi:hypothetical protein